MENCKVSRNGEREYCFEVMTPRKSYAFIAKDQYTIECWIIAIEQTSGTRLSFTLKKEAKTKYFSNQLSSPQSNNQRSSLYIFLESINLFKYCSILEKEEIDLETLQDISEEQLVTLGIPMDPRLKIIKRIEERYQHKHRQSKDDNWDIPHPYFILD